MLDQFDRILGTCSQGMGHSNPHTLNESSFDYPCVDWKPLHENFVIHARETLDDSLPRPWIFLAGPTPRNMETESWRDGAKHYFSQQEFAGTLLVPEDEDFGSFDEACMDQQVEWEWEGLDEADVIMFYVPRNMATMPGLTTNVEFGMYVTSGKIVLGSPQWADHNGYLERLAVRYDIHIARTLKETVAVSIEKATWRRRGR